MKPPMMTLADKIAAAESGEEIDAWMQVSRYPIATSPEAAQERDRLKALNAELVEALGMMVGTCEKVAEQQAVYDDWWEPNRDKARAVLAKARKGE